MLHILLTILKIIGIILLAILGILILSLCIAFFVPLRYELNAETKGDLPSTKVKIHFSWFLHFIAGQVTYLEEEIDYKIRILWKKITVKEEEAKSETTSKTPTETVSEPQDETAEETSVENSEETKEDPPVESSEKTEEDSSTETTEGQTKFQKIKCTIKDVCDKIKMVLEFLKGEPHKLSISKVKKEVIRLLISLKPKKLKGKVRFGMDDPYTTGQILAGLSVLYPIYGDNVEIFPEFDQKVLEGDVYIKGHVRGIHAIKMIFNIIIDKNVRTTIKDVKVLFEGN